MSSLASRLRSVAFGSVSAALFAGLNAALADQDGVPFLVLSWNA